MDQTGISKEARIDELEARLAQQDHSILALSDEIYLQQLQIAQLEIKVRHLAERLQLIEPPVSENTSTDEIPPHY